MQNTQEKLITTQNQKAKNCKEVGRGEMENDALDWMTVTRNKALGSIDI